MSTRERATLLLGILGALLLVIYPLAYRLTSQQAAASGASPSPGAAAQIASADAVRARDESWRADATKYRGANGGAFTFDCPPGGSLNPVWGTDTYTDDSSVCTAAVHAGVISFEEGGIVVVRIGPGHSAYVGTTRNGVRTSGQQQWDGSFEFVAS